MVIPSCGFIEFPPTPSALKADHRRVRASGWQFQWMRGSHADVFYVEESTCERKLGRLSRLPWWKSAGHAWNGKVTPPADLWSAGERVWEGVSLLTGGRRSGRASSPWKIRIFRMQSVGFIDFWHCSQESKLLALNTYFYIFQMIKNKLSTKLASLHVISNTIVKRLSNQQQRITHHCPLASAVHCAIKKKEGSKPNRSATGAKFENFNSRFQMERGTIHVLNVTHCTLRTYSCENKPLSDFDSESV